MDQTSSVLSTPRTSKLAAAAALFAFVLLAASACGGSTSVNDTASTSTDNNASQTDDTGAEDTVETTTADSSDAAEASETEAPSADESVEDSSAEDASVPSAFSGTFELILENGETFTSPVICTLEPQIAAGSEILFTVVGNHEGLLYDITQWGETSFGGTQSVEVVDRASFDPIWRSTGSTGLELELNGNTITGTGGFYPAEELNGPQTPGEVTVTC